MLAIAPVGALNALSIAPSVTATAGNSITIDLRRCTFVNTAGLVYLGTAMLDASLAGHPIVMTFDPGHEVPRYLDRMGIGDLAFRLGAVGDQFRPVKNHPPGLRFVELTTFDSGGNSVTEDVCQTMLARTSEWSIDSRRLNNTLMELGLNVEQHAGSPGLVAVQHYPGKHRVEFAVGDFGAGIPETLRTSGHTFESDVHAVRAAVETNLSRLDDQGRGAGLPGLRAVICKPDLRGGLTVQSRQGRVQYRSDAAVRQSPLRHDFPGTLVSGSFETG